MLSHQTPLSCQFNACLQVWTEVSYCFFPFARCFPALSGTPLFSELEIATEQFLTAWVILGLGEWSVLWHSWVCTCSQCTKMTIQSCWLPPLPCFLCPIGHNSKAVLLCNPIYCFCTCKRMAQVPWSVLTGAVWLFGWLGTRFGPLIFKYLKAWYIPP